MSKLYDDEEEKKKRESQSKAGSRSSNGLYARLTGAMQHPQGDITTTPPANPAKKENGLYSRLMNRTAGTQSIGNAREVGLNQKHNEDRRKKEEPSVKPMASGNLANTQAAKLNRMALTDEEIAQKKAETGIFNKGYKKYGTDRLKDDLDKFTMSEEDSIKARDITSSKRYEEALKKAAEEKELTPEETERLMKENPSIPYDVYKAYYESDPIMAGLKHYKSPLVGLSDKFANARVNDDLNSAEERADRATTREYEQSRIRSQEDFLDRNQYEEDKSYIGNEDYDAVNNKLNAGTISDQLYEGSHLTMEQRQNYNYVYNTAFDDALAKAREWTSDEEEAQRRAAESAREEGQKYLDMVHADEARTNYFDEFAREYGEEHPTLAAATSVALTPIKSVSAAGNLFNLMTGHPSDENSLINLPGTMSNTMRNSAQENLDKTWYGKLGYKTIGEGNTKKVFSAVTSVADNLLNSQLALGNQKALNLLFTTQAGNDSYVRYMEMGYSPEDAAVMGITSGAIEYLTEKYSIEQMFNMDSKGLMQVIKSTVAESSEEGASDILNEIADRVYFKLRDEESTYDKTISELMARGMSEEQAKAAYTKQFVNDLITDMEVGGLSGAGTNVAHQAMNKAQIEYNQAQAAYRLNDDARNVLLDLAKSSSDVKTKKMAERVLNKSDKEGNIFSKATNAYDTSKVIKRVIEENDIDNQIDKDLKADGVKNTEEVKNVIYKAIGGLDLTEAEEKVYQSEPVQKELSNIADGKLDATYERQVAVNEALEIARNGGKTAQTQNVTPSTETAENGAETKTESANTEDNSKKIIPISYYAKNAQMNMPTMAINSIEDIANVTTDSEGRVMIETKDGQRHYNPYSNNKLLNNVMHAATVRFNEGNAAKSFIENYKPGIGLDVYNDITNRMIRAGRADENISAVVSELKNDRGVIGAIANQLPVSFLNDMYTYGVNEEKIHSSIVASKEEQNFVNAVGKMFGVNVQITDENTSWNGKLDKGSNTIYLSKHADKALKSVLAHELTHYFKTKTALYDRFEKAVIDYMKESGNYDSLVEEYKKAGYSEEEINEEIAGDSSEMFFGDKKFAETVCKNDKTLAQQIMSWLKNTIRKLKKLFGDTQPRTSAARALQQNISKYEEIRDMWYEMFEEVQKADKSAQAANTLQNNEKYSQKFAEQIDAWDLKDPRKTFDVGITSDIYKQFGIDNKNVYLKSKKLVKIMSDHPEMTIPFIKKIPQVIQNPIAIAKSSSVPGRLVLISDVFPITDAKGDKPLIVALELNPTDRKGVSIDGVIIASAYGKDNITQNWLNRMTYPYVIPDSNKISRWNSRTRLQLPVGLSSALFKNNISSSNTNSNKTDKHSLKNLSDTQLQTDYDQALKAGNEELAAQIVEQYADNKGFTERLYHGTQDFGFTKLDPSIGDDGFSFFATNKPSIASSYSGVEGKRGIAEDVTITDDELYDYLKRRMHFKDIREFKTNDKKARYDYLNEKVKRLNDFVNKNYQRMREENLMDAYKDFYGTLMDGILFNNIDYKIVNQKMKQLKDAKFVLSDYVLELQNALLLTRESNQNKHAFILDGILKTAEDVRDQYVPLESWGNYELFANTDNMLEIDGKGDNWSDIRVEKQLQTVKHSTDELIKLLSDFYNGKRKVKYLADTDSFKVGSFVYERAYAENIVQNTYEIEHMNTRQIAQMAKEQGYKGVIIRNIFDDGGRNWSEDHITEHGNIYIFFNPESQCKSADTVTYDDQGNVIPLSERFKKENDDIRFSMKQPSEELGDIEQKAVEHFGTTENFRTAGYMLTDGTLLDFSGAHWLEGESPEYIADWKLKNDIRQVDHEDIYEVMEASGDNRKQFMDRGNIRLSPEAPGFNISAKVEPTDAQYRELKEFIREIKKNPYYDASRFYVDIEDTHPNKITYSNNLNEDRIINDIKKFYETGSIPEQSSLNDFRYSLKQLPDGTKYVKLDGNLFDDGKGGELSPREAYNKLVGTVMLVADGDNIEIIKNLPGSKQMYNELFKRRPGYDEPIDIKDVNEKINKNIIELVENSNALHKNAPDVKNRHAKNNIVGFDTREVHLADDKNAYILRLSIANLSDGRKIAYAKKWLEFDDNLAKKIKAATKSKSLQKQPSNKNISSSATKSNKEMHSFKQDNQVKSVDNLNPTDDPDIRYSKKMLDDIGVKLSNKYTDADEMFFSEDTWENSEAQNSAKNTADILKEGFNDLQKLKEAGKAHFTHADALKLAEKYQREYGTSTGKEYIANNIESIFAYIENNRDNVRYDDMLRVMRDAAMPIVEKQSNELAEYDDFRKYVKDLNISLNDQQRAEVINTYGSMKTFRKAIGSRINVTEDGQNIDSLWQDICEASGYYLDPDENSNTQILALADALDSMRNVSDNSGMSTSDKAYDLALNIFTDYFKLNGVENVTKQMKKQIEDYKTASEKMYKQILDNQKKESKAELDRLRNELKLVEADRARLAAARTLDTDELDHYDMLLKMERKQSANYEETLAQYDKYLDKQRKRILKLKADIEQGKIDRKSARLKAAESRQKTVLRNRIKSIVHNLSKMVTNPTEGSHVPVGLVNATIDVLQTIDLNTGKSVNMAEKLRKLSDKYQAIQKGYEDNVNPDYDATLEAMINQLRKTFEGRSIAKLTQSELEEVFKICAALQTQIRNTNKLINTQLKEDVYEAGQSIIDDVRAAKGVGEGKIANMANSYLTASVNAERFFNRLSGYKDDSTLNKLYEELNEGSHKMMEIEFEVSDIMKDVLEGSENQKLADKFKGDSLKDWVDIPFKDKNGNTIRVPQSFRASLALHMMNEQNLKHILYGGLTLPNEKLYHQGKIADAYARGNIIRPAETQQMREIYKQIRNTETVDERIELWKKYNELQVEAEKVGLAKLQDMVNSMTPYENAWVENAKKYFHEYSGKKINETSLKLNGYAKAVVDNYFPIKSDPSFTRSEMEGLKLDSTIEGWGNLKERVNGSNPIVLEGLDNVLNGHSKMLAKYAGMAIPIRNFNKVYNVTLAKNADSVKKAIKEKFGERSNKFISDLFTDLQTSRTRNDALSKVMNTIRSNYAQAVLTTNISVAWKQAASFPTAAAELGWDAIGKTFFSKAGATDGVELLTPMWLKKNTKEIMATAEKYTPLLKYRNLGNSTQELGDLKRQRTWLQKNKVTGKPVEWLTNWIQNIDVTTVASLWKASEYRVAKDNANLQPGTDEFYKEVAKVFNKAVERTQPNYTVLQRPDILRSPNEFLKQVFMFKTQPLQNLGIMIDATGNLKAKARAYKANPTAENKAKLNKAGKQMLRATTSQIAAAATFSAMTLAVNALLHNLNGYRDDDMELKLETILKKYFKDVGGAMAGSLPLGTELYDRISSWVTGDKWYDLSVSSIDTINNIIKDIDKIYNADSTTKTIESTKKLIKDTSMLYGIPLGNIEKIYNGGKYHIEDIKNDEFGSFEAGVERSTKVQSHRMYEALQDGDMDKFNEIYDEVGADKAMNGTSSVTSLIKADYMKDDISYDDALEYLKEIGFGKKDASDKIYGWNKDYVEKAYKEGKMDAEEAMKYLENHNVSEEEADEIIKKCESDLIQEDYVNDDIDYDEALSQLQDAGYSKEESITQIQKWETEYIKKEYENEKVTEEEVADYLEPVGISRNDAHFLVQQWETGNTSDYASVYEAIDNYDTKAVKAAVKELKQYGYDNSTINAQITQKFKDKYVELYKTDKSEAIKLKSAILTYYQAIGKDREQKNKDINDWVK